MKPTRPAFLSPDRRRLGLALGVLVLGAGLSTAACAGSEARMIPPYAGAASAGPGPGPAAASETAVFAGGCFWGVQGVFQHVKGVSNAVSGYAGGDPRGANYDAVSTGQTGHAESVRIDYDPRQISYARLLHVFFSVAHDPTQLNRQGPDRGTQYRSAIFPVNAEQAAIAKAYIEQLDKAKVFPGAIVTRIEADRPFFPAEAYHQDFLVRNPTYPYIVYNDLPKIEDLKRMFPALYRPDPVLVSGMRKAG